MTMVIISGTILAQESQYAPVNLKKLINEGKKLKGKKFNTYCPEFFKETITYTALHELQCYAKNKRMHCLGKLPITPSDSAIIIHHAEWSYDNESATFKYEGPLPLPEYKIDFVEQIDSGVTRHEYVFIYNNTPSATDTVFMDKIILIMVTLEIFECHNENEKLYFNNDPFYRGLLALDDSKLLYQGFRGSYFIGKNSE